MEEVQGRVNGEEGGCQDTADEEKMARKQARKWKVDFVMGMVIVAVGLPFFATDYKAVGGIMAAIGGFCIVSGLCQKVVKGEEKRQRFAEALGEVRDGGAGEGC